MLDFLNQQTKIIQVESTQNSSLQYLSSSALLLPSRFLDHSSSSFGSSSLVFQIVFSFMCFPNQFFRSSLDLHAEFLCTSSTFAFSRSFFFFLWIRFFGFSNRLQLHAFSKLVLQIVFGSSCIFQIGSSYHLQIVLLLPSNLVLRFFKSSSSSCIFQIDSLDHLHLHLCSSIELESEKLKFHVNKLLHLSTRTRVLEAQFCH